MRHVLVRCASAGTEIDRPQFPMPPKSSVEQLIAPPLHPLPPTPRHVPVGVSSTFPYFSRTLLKKRPQEEVRGHQAEDGCIGGGGGGGRQLPPPPTTHWPQAPGEGGFWEGRLGVWGVFGGRGFGRVSWGGGVQVGRFGGYMPPTPSVGQSQAPLTSPPSDHTITLNFTLTFAASWFGMPAMLIRLNKIMAAFWQITALHFGPQH